MKENMGAFDRIPGHCRHAGLAVFQRYNNRDMGNCFIGYWRCLFINEFDRILSALCKFSIKNKEETS